MKNIKYCLLKLGQKSQFDEKPTCQQPQTVKMEDDSMNLAQAHPTSRAPATSYTKCVTQIAKLGYVHIPTLHWVQSQPLSARLDRTSLEASLVIEINTTL